MARKEKLNKLIEKYDLKNKSIDELQKLIGDSDRGCMTAYEANFLKGETFIDKASNIYNFIHNEKFFNKVNG